MGKTRKFVKWIPEELFEEVHKMVHIYIYQNDEEYRKIYEAIKAQPTVSLKKIMYDLKPLGITKSLAKMKEIAETCSLPYTL